MTEYKTKEQKSRFYNSGDWKRMREYIKKRDGYECQECKRQGKVSVDTYEYSQRAKRKKIKLVVDHIKELEECPDLALDDENLETLCVTCHNIKHGRYFRRFEWKRNKWEDDERW
ncbi:HNH endonuclease [Priestia flexa]|uniref:HNH endonuclease n=1 Tax=Priestia flexa TaxID=86664 RepID=UPI003D04F1F6